jgi:hypothetical protein
VHRISCSALCAVCCVLVMVSTLIAGSVCSARSACSATLYRTGVLYRQAPSAAVDYTMVVGQVLRTVYSASFPILTSSALYDCEV